MEKKITPANNSILFYESSTFSSWEPMLICIYLIKDKFFFFTKNPEKEEEYLSHYKLHHYELLLKTNLSKYSN